MTLGRFGGAFLLGAAGMLAIAAIAGMAGGSVSAGGVEAGCSNRSGPSRGGRRRDALDVERIGEQHARRRLSPRCARVCIGTAMTGVGLLRASVRARWPAVAALAGLALWIAATVPANAAVRANEAPSKILQLVAVLLAIDAAASLTGAVAGIGLLAIRGHATDRST